MSTSSLYSGQLAVDIFGYFQAVPAGTGDVLGHIFDCVEHTMNAHLSEKDGYIAAIQVVPVQAVLSALSITGIVKLAKEVGRSRWRIGIKCDTCGIGLTWSGVARIGSWFTSIARPELDRGKRYDIRAVTAVPAL